jgi:hypothetical protein
MRNLETYEEQVMEALVRDILDCQDPVDQFKLIDRYSKFVEARSRRIEGESHVKAKR